jgi:hypothetical protein
LKDVFPQEVFAVLRMEWDDDAPPPAHSAGAAETQQYGAGPLLLAWKISSGGAAQLIILPFAFLVVVPYYIFSL